MARGVKGNAPIAVHQALHGYADGHRLLASSIALKPRDAKVVLTLSDASGSTSGIPETGYLTGYPLPDPGLYVLAKTWPAPEMPRPGCVWTHTFLVDFADLAALGDLSTIARAFVRPVPGQAHPGPYGVDLLLPPEEGPTPSKRAVDQPGALRRLLWALYGQPDERVFSTDGDAEVREAMVMALWSQQWPSLRRSFRFCTLVFSDRSTDNAPFDLQFASRNDRAHRSRLIKLFDADREPPESPAWLEGALLDLLGTATSGLRAFLRGFGAEVGGGRGLFAPLCELHGLLAVDQPSAEALSRAVTLLEGKLAGAEAREARALLVRRLVGALPTLGSEQLAFVMRHLGAISSEDLDRAATYVGRAVWARDPEQLLKLLRSDVPHEVLVARKTLHEIPTEALLGGLQERPESVPAALEARPELLMDPELWRLEDRLGRAARDVAFGERSVSIAVLDAMIESGNASLAVPARSAVGEDAVLAALVARIERCGADRASDSETSWLAAVGNPNAFARLLSRALPKQRTTLLALARQVHPDEVPNDYGDDPWLTAIQGTHGNLSPAADLLFRGWVLARGLGYRSRNQAQLLAFGFESVYLAALERRLMNEAWQYLSDRLPNSTYWSDWEPARRLRTGIVEAFVGHDLDPGVFGRLLTSEPLFSQLTSDARWMSGGRGYLRRVKRALRDSQPGRFSERIANLERLLQ